MSPLLDSDPLLGRLERNALAFCLVAAGVALVMRPATPSIALGVLGGGALAGLSYWAIRLGSRLLARLPLAVGYALADLAADATWRVWGGIRARSIENMRWIVGRSAECANNPIRQRPRDKTPMENRFMRLSLRMWNHAGRQSNYALYNTASLWRFLHAAFVNFSPSLRSTPFPFRLPHVARHAPVSAAAARSPGRTDLAFAQVFWRRRDRRHVRKRNANAFLQGI